MTFRVLPFLVVGFLACSKSNHKANADLAGSVHDSVSVATDTTPSPPPVDSSSSADAVVYRSVESDSFLIQRGNLFDRVATLLRKGKKLPDKDMTTLGSPCISKVRKYKLSNNTLIVIKGDCGDAGFENHQFVKHGDSLKVYRKYKMEYRNDNTSLSEDIYEFRGTDVIFSRRYKNTKGWKDLSLADVPFAERTGEGERDYLKFKEWLKGAD